jgi:hypothetical protein
MLYERYVYFGSRDACAQGLRTFFMNTGRPLRLLFYGVCIDYREKKHGSKTCAIVALRNDTGTEPDDDRKHRY